VIVCADLLTLDKIELYRLDLTFSSTPDRLSSLFQIADGDVTKVVVSPNGAWAAFRADSALDERFDLLRVPSDGSTSPVRVHAAPPSTFYDVDETAIEFTPDSAGIVYAADHETNGKLDLWISDAMVFRADFEGGGLEEWSTATP
jgi:hypothetical protein